MRITPILIKFSKFFFLLFSGLFIFFIANSVTNLFEINYSVLKRYMDKSVACSEELILKSRKYNEKEILSNLSANPDNQHFFSI